MLFNNATRASLMLVKGHASVECKSLISETSVRKQPFEKCSTSLLSPNSAGNWQNAQCIWDGIKGQKNKNPALKAPQLCAFPGWKNGWLGRVVP